MHHLIIFVKDEGINLMFMMITLHSIIDSHLLKLQQVYKVCVLVTLCLKPTNDEKATMGLKHINVKATQGNS
jgi:hypothetical protein